MHKQKMGALKALQSNANTKYNYDTGCDLPSLFKQIFQRETGLIQ